MMNKSELLIKKVFMLLNGLPPGYAGTRKFFKAALISMFGVTYNKYFTRIGMNKNISSIRDFKNNEQCQLFTLFYVVKIAVLFVCFLSS